ENGRGVSNTPKNDSKMGEFDSPQRGEISVWQRDYFEKIIRNQKAFKNITKYIQDNPKKWKQ
ncbi:MAG: hypothetical protein LAT51_12905, partial [Flavobacteriaceae bacterium]|nr:hypothetical protein [Flavobacteriaceae bacterium]